MNLIRKLHFEIDIEDPQSVADTVRLPSILQGMETGWVWGFSKKAISSKSGSSHKVVLRFPKLDTLEIHYKIHSSRSRDETNQRFSRYADDSEREFSQVLRALTRIKVRNPIITGLGCPHVTRGFKEGMTAIPEP